MMANGLWNPAVCLIEASFPNSVAERWKACSLNSLAGWSGLGRLQKGRRKVGEGGSGGEERRPGSPLNISASQITAQTPGKRIYD